MRAALRNAHPVSADGSPPEKLFHLHEMTIDFEKRLVTVTGQRVHLTQTELNILALLARHAGKLMTYAAMHSAIWGENDPSGVQKLQVNMANLRKKLGVRPGDNRYIVNELGVATACPQKNKRCRQKHCFCRPFFLRMFENHV